MFPIQPLTALGEVLAVLASNKAATSRFKTPTNEKHFALRCHGRAGLPSDWHLSTKKNQIWVCLYIVSCFKLQCSLCAQALHWWYHWVSTASSLMKRNGKHYFARSRAMYLQIVISTTSSLMKRNGKHYFARCRAMYLQIVISTTSSLMKRNGKHNFARCPAMYLQNVISTTSSLMKRNGKHNFARCPAMYLQIVISTTSSLMKRNGKHYFAR